MGDIRLRDYQEDIVRNTRSLMNSGHKSILIQLSTGGGKTVIASQMLKTCMNKGFTAYMGVHRRELLHQTIKTLGAFNVPCGVISSGFPSHPQCKVQVCSIPTMFRRLKTIKEPKLFFWDEARFIGAKTWTKIYKAFPNSYHVLLDATPCRLDGKPLGEYATAMVQGPSMRELIEKGHLADYKAYAPFSVDTSSIKSRMGDFVKSQLDELMYKPAITGSAIKEYKKYCNGKRAVVFCVSVKHSEHVAREFNQYGVPAKHIDGTTNKHERDSAIREFASGKIKVLTNVDIASCGLDIPAMEAVVLLRPTQSLSLYLQQVGRSLRPFPGKSHAIILDHVGNIERHGLPDQERDWSLLGKKGRLSQGSKSEPGAAKVCSFCFAAQAPGSDKCIHCGKEFDKKEREILEVDGELAEIDKSKFQRIKRQEQGKAQSLEELVQLGIKRGYRAPRRWAQHVFQARQAKRNRGVS